MQKPGAVHSGERGAQIETDERGFARAERPAALHRLPKRLAAHELHPQADAIVVLLGTVDLHDVRVAHAGKPPRLFENAGVRLAPIALVVEQLERDVAVERRVPRTKDLAGRTVTNPIEEREAAPMRTGRAAREQAIGPGARDRSSSSSLGEMLRWRLAMLSTRRRCRTSRRFSASACDSALAQSTGAPSATSAAASTSARSSALNVHLLRQSDQCPRHGHSGRVGARLAVRRSDLRVTLLQLDASDDDFPLFGPQPLQRLFVPLHRLVADRFVERRRRRIGMLGIVLDARRRRIPRDPPNLVADAIDERLPQVRLQRTVVTRLEILDMPKRLGERLLHQVFGVPKVTGPSRQTSPRPAPQRALVPPNQVIQRLRVALPGATNRSVVEVRLGEDGLVSAMRAMTKGASCRHGTR